MLNKTNQRICPPRTNSSTPKSNLPRQKISNRVAKKSLCNALHLSASSNSGSLIRRHGQQKGENTNKIRPISSIFQDKNSQTIQRYSNNKWRAKTEGGQILSELPKQIKMQSDSKMFHPAIYHQPKVRKQLFCQVIDSYMKQMAESSKGKSFRRFQSLKNQNKQYEFKLKNQTIFQSQAQHQFNSMSNSNVNTGQVKKRAQTAGYERKQYRMDNQKGNKKYIKQSQLIFKALDDSCDSQKLQKNRKINVKINNKEKVKNKFKTIAQSDIKQKKRSRIQIGCNPQLSFSNSNGSSDDGPNRIQDFLQVQMQVKNHHNSNLRMNANRKTKEHLNKSKQSKKQYIYQAENSSKQFVNQQQQIIKQIKQSIIFMSNQSETQWNTNVLHRHLLFTIFLLHQSPSNQQRSVKSSGIQTQRRIKVKQFNSIFQGQQMRNALQKIQEYGVTHIWRPLPKIQLKFGIQNSYYYSPYVRPLRQQLFQFRREQKSDDTVVYRIRRTKAHNQLFYNKCQYLKDIIVSVAKDLLKMRGNIINNKISLDNLYRIQQKCLKVGDWGCSAFKRKLMVGGKQVIFRDEPFLKIQNNQAYQYSSCFPNQKVHYSWLLSPENMPPQIIQCMINGCYSKIWQIQECPEVWSLGIMIYQILTGVPVWMPDLAALGHNTPKRGLFYDGTRRLPVIYSLQLKMPSIIARWIRDDRNSDVINKIDPQILSLMKAMLQINTKLRPTPEQIIRILS